MPKFTTLKDSNYLKGMNSVDDPKALGDGECVELVNAVPDYPLRMRRGCAGKIILESGSVESRPFYARFGDYEYVFFWAGIYLYCMPYTPDYPEYMTADTVKYISSPDNPVMSIGVNQEFDFVRIGDIVYTRASNPSSIQNYKMIAIEYVPVLGVFMGRVVPHAGHDVPGLDETSLRYDTADGRKVFTGNFAFGYSLTLVRRTDNGGIMTAYAPGLIESCEAPSKRRGIIRDSSAAGDTSASIYIRPSGLLWADNSYGFTHVRIYRTRNLYSKIVKDGLETDAERQQFVNGAARYFLMDVPVSHFYGDAGRLIEIEDTVSEGALLGETNQLTSYNYTMPPPDGYRMLYFKDRLFLMGEWGKVYFSEIPGGDGGGDTEFAQTEKDKYALWFKPLHNRIDLDAEERTASTGLDYLGDDLYLFKSNKVYMILGGNPVLSPPRSVSDKSGCPFPDTIRRAILFGQEALFYLSGAGPVIISAGGNSRPFTEFRVKELWAETGSELFKAGVDYNLLSLDRVRWCSAAFWDGTLWIFFQLKDDENYGLFKDTKIFGFRSTSETNGAFEVSLANLNDKYNINNLAITSGNHAVTISNMSGYPASSKVAAVRFLADESLLDTLRSDDGAVIDRARPEFRLLSRKIYPGPLERNMSEMFRAVAYCDFGGGADKKGHGSFRL
ncbi:MAG: hypothetical protein LBB56_04695, partial [Chitinispirillales bacterium]|nr:hypothetical protein [Chitinispirillales bacterium]